MNSALKHTNMIEISSLNKNNISFEANEGSNSVVTLTDFHSDCRFDVKCKKEAHLHISILAKENLNNVKITADIYEKASISLYLADFSIGDGIIEVTINLIEEGASVEWHLASLSSNNDRKRFDININHLAMNTVGLSDNYGVCKDSSKLIFAGSSHVNRGSKHTKTRQNARIILFDKSSIGLAKPILKIDEKDIEASHGATIGQINDDHIFYLTSRGIPQEEAKKLIIFGYLKPIINGFYHESTKEDIISLIERRLKNE